MSARQLTLVASTLTNACGVGWPAVRETLRNGRSALRPFDLEWAPPFATWIGRAPGLESVRMPDDFPEWDSRNNRLAHLCLEQDDFPAAVAAAVARHGRDRIGLFVGTTTSGILSTELAYRARLAALPEAGMRAALVRDVHNMHATTAFVRCRLGLSGPVQTISTACSSSAKVFAAAARFISAGLCDAAVVGGVDSLALSTLFGFRALDLVSTGPCRPFAADRDGISIGEGAGFALLEPGGDGPVCLLGYGESSDAWHMSSPHPDGAGAVVAMRAALTAAGVDATVIDYVNLHGTASRANDAAEDRAITTVFPATTPVSSTKGFTGHVLGAAGITEALITTMALVDQWIPGTVNCTVVDPTLGAAVVRESRAQLLRAAMSNSFGFGGSNCALVFGVAK
ncbi:MAG TPA: beta-ketoacyl-ACP synthase [Casimicrobiaceae bacterium]|jgi:3-oxoacyl-[acyl-carrier-protein] synthase-1|nr:beta-ketoacyl-ACP synthase [Casimicrobiaceae bacterium]